MKNLAERVEQRRSELKMSREACLEEIQELWDNIKEYPRTRCELFNNDGTGHGMVRITIATGEDGHVELLTSLSVGHVSVTLCSPEGSSQGFGQFPKSDTEAILNVLARLLA